MIVHESECNNCAHCVELYTPKLSDPLQVKEARTLVYYYFNKWINEH
jgi:hypothetical protein